ncbi:hypothetical protein PM082_008136 [Marasmius tenuissimus]|nr:hypothetical protein PM082_008136 [Marasmius tenuissimus]
MTSITPTSIPIFTEEKRLTGRKTWNNFKREVLLQVGSKGMTGYLNGSIPRPKLQLSTTTRTVRQTTSQAAQTDDTNEEQSPPPTVTATPTVTPTIVVPTVEHDGNHVIHC